MYGHSGDDYRVATLSKLYLTTKGIAMQSLESIGQSNLFKLTKRSKLSVTYGPTLIVEKPCFQKLPVLNREVLSNLFT